MRSNSSSNSCESEEHFFNINNNNEQEGGSKKFQEAICDSPLFAAAFPSFHSSGLVNLELELPHQTMQSPYWIKVCAIHAPQTFTAFNIRPTDCTPLVRLTSDVLTD
jgi:hypothetical protein